MTCLVSVEHPQAPLFYEIRDDTNNRWDFLNFVIQAIEAGYIGYGDYLLVDNASIHAASDMVPLLDEVLALVGAQRLKLPTYSPEFQPAEPVFADVKHHLRYNYVDAPLELRIAWAMGSIEFSKIVAIFGHCTSHGLRRLARGY